MILKVQRITLVKPTMRWHEVVIRGWAILESDLIKTAETEIRHHLSECQVLSLEITPKKSYSSSTSYVSIEAHLIRD